MKFNLKILLRGLFKSKLTSLINILGLSLGMATFLVINVFVKKENSFDKFHKDSDQLFRVVIDNKTPSGITRFVTTGPPTGEALQEDYSEVINFVTMKRGDEHLVRVDDRSFYEDNLYYVGSSFFDIFSFELLQGNKSTALRQPNSVVITEKIAEKYFGNENPLGELINLDGNRDLKITGVMKSSYYTHIDIDFMVSFETYEYPDFGSADDWGWVTFYNYIKLKKGVDPDDFEKRLSQTVFKYFSPERYDNISLHLQAVEDIYLTPSEEPSNEIGATSNIMYSKILFAAALLILIIACLNYVNLSTAGASRRAKEVGVKKSLGASRNSLLMYFLSESFLINIIASILAILISALFIRSLGNMLNIELADAWSFIGEILITLVFITISISVVAGFYPAFILSSFEPKRVLKGSIHQGKNTKGIIRKTFVGVQIIISFLLIIGTLTIFKQLEFIRNKDLGFDKENILVVPLKNEEMRSRYRSFETHLEQNSLVRSVASARLGLEGLHGSYQLIPQGGNLENAPRMSIYPVGYDFIETLNISMVSGRTFDRNFQTDTLHQFILNRSAIEQLGWSEQEALGQKGMLTGQGGIYGVVVGVVEDFHFEPLRNIIDPLVLLLRPNLPYYVYIKSDALPSRLIREVQSDFQTIYSGYPFEYEFLDDRINKNYMTDSRFGFILTIFSVLAIAVGCIGLFGLTVFEVNRRNKEIGIRKVLGAGVRSIVYELNKEFILILIISSLIVIPLGYSGAASWLQNFAYHISIRVEIFALAFLIVTGIILVTVSYKTLKAAMTNPVNSIRYE